MVRIRKLGTIFLVCSLLLIFKSTAFAVVGQISDQAGLMDEKSRQELLEQIENLELEYKVPVIIYTSTEDLSQNVRDRADDLLAEYVGNDNSGLLLYLNTNTRDYYFTLSGKVLRMIDNKRQKSLDDNLLLNLKAGDYNKAFMSFFDEAARYIKGGEIQGNILVNEKRLTAKDFKIAGIGGLTTFLISFFGLKKSSTPRPSKFVYYLSDNSNLGYAISGDSCIKTFKTSRVIPKNSSNSSGGSTTTTHKGSSGGSFSGRGGKF